MKLAKFSVVLAILGLAFLKLGRLGFGGGTLAAPLEPSSTARLVGAVVVSLVVLAGGLYVILSKKYAADAEKWAFGAVGTILGYWLA